MGDKILALTDFLLARIAEDEARTSHADRNRIQPAVHGSPGCLSGDVVFVHAFTPGRVLAECEAKRRIVELHYPSSDHGPGFDPYCVGCWEEGGEDGAPLYPCRTARFVAAVYADHPDFREEWRV